MVKMLFVKTGMEQRLPKKWVTQTYKRTVRCEYCAMEFTDRVVIQ